MLRNHFQIGITDGMIRVTNMATNQDFIEFRSADVIKNDLLYLFASSGHAGKGHIQVLQSTKTIKTHYLPNVQWSYQLMLDNINEMDAIDVFAPGFTKNIDLLLRIVSS